jgi:hypothetical protein
MCWNFGRASSNHDPAGCLPTVLIRGYTAWQTACKAGKNFVQIFSCTLFWNYKGKPTAKNSRGSFNISLLAYSRTLLEAGWTTCHTTLKAAENFVQIFSCTLFWNYKGKPTAKNSRGSFNISLLAYSRTLLEAGWTTCHTTLKAAENFVQIFSCTLLWNYKGKPTAKKQQGIF